MKSYKFQKENNVIIVEAPKKVAIKFIEKYYPNFKLCNDSNIIQETSTCQNQMDS